MVSLTDYITALDFRIIRQLLYPNMTHHSDLILDIEVYNINFVRLVEKIQEHDGAEIKRFVKSFRLTKGPVFIFHIIVKDIFTLKFNWTEEEFARLKKCLNDTKYIRERFFEAYDNNTEWLNQAAQGNATHIFAYHPKHRKYTTEDYLISEESANNYTDEPGSRFRVPPFKRGKPFTPPTMIVRLI